MVELPRTATREALGTISFISSSLFPLISGASVDNPVMFPPGRARLGTSPFPTGSLSCAVTMGIVTVASLAARVAAGPLVRITSTLRRTSSAARPRSRSALPCANRHSIRMFFPSTYPNSQTLPKCLDADGDSGRRVTTQVSNPKDFHWLLRLSGKAKRKEHRAKRKTNDLPSHESSILFALGALLSLTESPY